MHGRNLVLTAALLGFSGVALGAFGAHGLQATLEATGRAATFETASRYHLIHALAMLGAAWLAGQTPGRWARLAGWYFAAGTLVFSGSLYLLAVSDVGWLGAVAPVGGALLLAGWACLGWAAWQASPNSSP